MAAAAMMIRTSTIETAEASIIPNSLVTNSRRNCAPSEQPITTCEILTRMSGTRPSRRPRMPTTAPAISGPMNQPLG